MGSALNANIPEGVKVVLSDANWELINFYNVVKSQPEKVEALANSWTHEENSYYEIRNWDRSEDWRERHSPLEIAARTIYLNKRCFNGLYRINVKGNFNSPWNRGKNFRKINVVDHVECLEFLQKIDITLSDWSPIVENTFKGDLLYCDPPYVDTKNAKANFNGYMKRFGFSEQVELRDALIRASERGVKVVVSNSWCDETIELYKEFCIKEITASRTIGSTAGSRGTIKELLAWR